MKNTTYLFNVLDPRGVAPRSIRCCDVGQGASLRYSPAAGTPSVPVKPSRLPKPGVRESGLRSEVGLTILEMLVAVAVLGVLLSIGPLMLPRDSMAVRQEADSVSRLVEWARFEAVRRNAHVSVRVDAANASVEVFEFDPFAGTEARIRTHDVGAFGVDIATVSEYPVAFDTRGLRDPITGFALASMELAKGSSARFVCVNAQGKATVQAAGCS